MNRLEEHRQWPTVKDVCSRLRSAGFEALLAGGCVRDLIMNREPNDFDVATNATPDQVEALFEKSLAVGKAFGVIVLPFSEFQIEVATFREDLDYKDGRRPEGVKFSTARADSQRRDFTVNALFYDPATAEIIDYVGGRKDIADRILRTVGEPDHRFDEDKLRILRAIRFAAQLDFSIEPETRRAVEDRARDVAVVSMERIRDEIQKLLKAKHRVRGLELLFSTGVLKSTLPSLAEAIELPVWLRSFEALEEGIDDPLTLLALFLWPVCRDPIKSVRSLKLDGTTVDQLLAIFKDLEVALNPSLVRAGELAYRLTKPHATALLAVADTLVRSDALTHELFDRTKWNEALATARPGGVHPATPFLSGRDLIALGAKPGPQMGELIHEAYLKQLEGEFRTRADAEAWARKQI